MLNDCHQLLISYLIYLNYNLDEQEVSVEETVAARICSGGQTGAGSFQLLVGS